MEDILSREDGISDKDYIKRLESFITEIIDSKKSLLISYLGLKNFIETNSLILQKLELAPDEETMKKMYEQLDDSDIQEIKNTIADFGDKRSNQMMKFSEKLKTLNSDLIEMRSSLAEAGVDIKKAEKKFLRDSEVSVEKIIGGF